MTVLVEGSTGPEVLRVQDALKAAGYFIGNENGTYGRHTMAAVAYLQSCHSLDIDGYAGPQVYTALGLTPPAGAMHGTRVHIENPRIDVLSTDEYAVTVRSEAPTKVRIVVWFRGPGGEHYGEETVEPHPGADTWARIQIPDAVKGNQGEWHVTTYAFDDKGNVVDEAIEEFRVDLPDRVT